MTRDEALKLDAGPELDELISQKLFGWQWWSFIGMTTRSNPDYGKGKMRVREFMPPEQYKNKRWREFFAANEGRLADGTEPLSYSYCSSNGPARCLSFSRSQPDAWCLVPLLRSHWGTFSLIAGLQWHCFSDEQSKGDLWGSGDTEMIAISRAALIEFWELKRHFRLAEQR